MIEVEEREREREREREKGRECGECYFLISIMTIETKM